MSELNAVLQDHSAGAQPHSQGFSSNVSAPATCPEVGAATPPNTHTLDTPIVRGSQTITTVALRKPASGELRGVSLSDLVNLDVTALSRVLPRISSPTLTEQDVAQMDPADLVMLGGLVVGFLTPKAVKSKVEFQTA
ncbi:phage tail assembly protein [Trinickia symbiotica]|uniref:Phage tail assembly protein n=1 Tax=Trinickia symbiotica TaxID=863227 RepID=A0A2T3XSQ0_9BURK|nr:phage tail assembly protein [Trinickia symbiotica]PTB19556.1 phage tail assembly protein [Trinickia symbiotica]